MRACKYEACGTKFEPKSLKQLYCGPQCAKRHHYEKKTQQAREERENTLLTCHRAGCGNQFKQGRIGTLFCSARCVALHHYHLNKLEAVAYNPEQFDRKNSGGDKACKGCIHARLNPHSWRGVECVAELYAECQPLLSWKRLYYRRAQ